MADTKSSKTKNDATASKEDAKENKPSTSAISAVTASAGSERSKKSQQHHAFDPKKHLLMKNRNKRHI
uniref:Uncharacterized protein n=1 Tax=Panagrolaimus sp. JU765 TaxID=591449 RepID=A0AC34RS77_9BILA